MSKKVSDILPKTEILGQLAEELAEASAAASKLRRKIDGKNPTPKTLEECWEDLKKEIGDVMNAIDALTEQDSQNYHEFMSECGEYAEPKMERWLSRLEAKENENAECHVICGLFGNVYAGTYAVPCKDDLQVWRSMKEVTSEAIEAVVNHFIIKMEHDGKNKIQKTWGVRGGKTLKVTFELSSGKKI